MRKACFVLAFSMFVGNICAQQSYCVENDITHAYLNDFTYDTIPDLNVSYIMQYFRMPHDYRLDAPVPANLSWTHDAGAESQRLEVSEWADFSDPLIYALDADTAQYELYNLIPGRKYYYRILSVKGGNTKIVGSGELEPTGMLRWVYAQGTWNVRDMGGWIGLDGYPIKYGKLYRGGQLTNPNSPYNVLLTESGIEAMRNVGIRAELDLRSSSQAHFSTTSIAGDGYAADFTNIATTSARMWKYDNDDSNIRAIQWVINELKAGKPVFYHCQNGADRTGTIGLLIGALLGMSDGDLAKDYELTTFCEAAAAEFDPTEKGFARLRNYEGKKGSVDSNKNSEKDYMFAPVIDKWNAMAGASTQEKVYNFFLNGKNGTKISKADLDWFINYMAGPLDLNGKSTFDMERGETRPMGLIVSRKENNPDPVVTYSTSDSSVAIVSQDGIITAVRGGVAEIKAELEGYYQIVTVNVAKKESELPASVHADGKGYLMKGKNIIKNGSFEYAEAFSDWKDGTGAALSAENFSVKSYADSDDRYIESKGDGDETSASSINIQWRISSNKTYVFGYKVKNSTDIQTVNNENLKVMLTKTNASLPLDYPSYDGNWTDVQYVFTNSDRYSKVQILFTHLSQNGNNTCFDDFYLVEVEYSAGVGPVRYDVTDGNVYDLNGRKVGQAVEGIIIKDGKKVLIK